MKKFGEMPWIALVCILMETLALVFVTLVLVCPAPFEHSNLSLIIVSPVSNSTTTNGATSSLLNSTSSVGSALPTSTYNNTIANATSTTSLSTSAATNTDVKKAVSDSDATTTTKTSGATASTASTSATNAAQLKRRADPLMTPMELEKMPTNDTTIGNYTATSISTLTSNSTLLLRIGPLGSCFRNSKNVEICTPSKLYSTFDFTKLQSANFTTDGLPSGMSTYPLILLLVIIALLIKVGLNLVAVVAPKGVTPDFMVSLSSTWEAMSNWTVCMVAILLVIASGVEKNKLTSAVNSFNTSNEAKMMDSTSLLAQTGTSFGFLWIAVALLIISFLFKRFAIKRQVATDRAMQQIQVEYGQSYLEQQKAQPPLQQSKAGTWILEQQPLPPPSMLPSSSNRRQSGMQKIRSFLPSTMMRREEPPMPATTNISMPTLVLDDYVRRHYYQHRDDSVSNLPPLAYHNDYRTQTKESPPFHAYQSSLDGEQTPTRQEQQEAQYVEDLRIRMASPAPSYWTTSNERVQDLKSRRERERQYMADLRKQRSAQDV